MRSRGRRCAAAGGAARMAKHARRARPERFPFMLAPVRIRVARWPEEQQQSGSDCVKLITWNIQWCRGCDGRVDPARIARVASEMADFDVLCLQEVASNYPDLAGSVCENH